MGRLNDAIIATCAIAIIALLVQNHYTTIEFIDSVV